MSTNEPSVSLEQARSEVGKAIRRLALLHLAFSETLVKELGDEQGKRLIVKAMRNFGQKIGGAAREAALARGDALTAAAYRGGRNEYPSLGTHVGVEPVVVNGEPRTRAYGCLLEKVWKEYGGEELGRLYCLVDVSQFMAYNPELKHVHIKAEPDGDPYCELAIRKTTEQERADFDSDADWSYIDFGNE